MASRLTCFGDKTMNFVLLGKRRISFYHRITILFLITGKKGYKFVLIDKGKDRVHPVTCMTSQKGVNVLYMMYLLTAIGLSPGGSSTVHI